MSDKIQEQRQREFTEKSGQELFDLLAYELPDELKRRVVFQRCPHCRRRPELVKRRALTFYMQLRPYSQQHVEVNGYELIPCCSAMYEIGRTQTTVSKLMIRRVKDAAQREVSRRVKTTGKPGF